MNIDLEEKELKDGEGEETREKNRSFSLRWLELKTKLLEMITEVVI